MSQREDPKRLRECLAALSEACGHDVFRFETLSTKTGLKFVITCSNKAKEETIAILIAHELRRQYEKVELDVSGLGKKE